MSDNIQCDVGRDDVLHGWMLTAGVHVGWTLVPGINVIVHASRLNDL